MKQFSTLIHSAPFILFLLISESGIGQALEYYPLGNPKKFNVELTPFLWLPWVSGNATAAEISKDFNADPVDLIRNLKMAFMFTADVSRGKFFISPTWVYTKLATDRVLRTNHEGNDALVAMPSLKMNVLGFVGGMRLPLAKQFILDPYVGFRYDNINTTVKIEGQVDTTSATEILDFWDPVVGFQAHYFPIPRVPITLKADIGGFGAGSKLSWTTALNFGYSVSTVVDLFIGFIAYGFDYESTTANGGQAGIATVMYGADLGIRIILPKRFRDPALFKKKK
jgi:hypothetical protein